MALTIQRLLAFVSILWALPIIAEDRPTRDLEYANVDGASLKLDLYLPETRSAPLVVWIHGGAWRGGSKSNPPILELQKRGFAIASVDYRLSTEAPFPAQIHDIKAAIRFLRAQAA